MKDLIIPGYPSPTIEQVKLFQRNNRIEVDGLVGPQTRGACWHDEGSRKYTHLAWHIREKQGARLSAEWARRTLGTMQLPLGCEHVMTLLELLSSEWSTGLDYMSTQDGLTMGMRRRAGTGLLAMLREIGVELGKGHLPTKNNCWPCNKPELRARLITLAGAPGWWMAQIEDYLDALTSRLQRHKMCEGRAIALYERASNSSRTWVKGCRSYRALKESYSGHKRGPSRIRRIETRIPDGEMWR